jgi:hypothetical protein
MTRFERSRAVGLSEFRVHPIKVGGADRGCTSLALWAVAYAYRSCVGIFVIRFPPSTKRVVFRYCRLSL